MSSTVRSPSLVGWLRRALRASRSRVLLTIAGVAAATLLVLVLAAARRGITEDLRIYLGQPGMDLWIAPPGADNLVRSGGFVPLRSGQRARAVAGVAAIDPVLRTFVAVDSQRGQRRSTLLALGFRPGGLGGPPRILAGREPRGPGELLLDRAAAFRLGVNVGGPILAGEEDGRVVGISAHTNLLVTQFAFSEFSATEAALGIEGRASFLIVRLAGTRPAAEVAADIARLLPKMTVFTREQFLANNEREVSVGFYGMMVMLTAIGVAVTALVVLLLAEAMVEDRRSEIAMLLALGAPPGRIAAALLANVTFVVLVGSLLGGAASGLLAAGLDAFLPTITLAASGRNVVLVTLLFVVVGGLASLWPLRRVARLDPLEAFRG